MEKKEEKKVEVLILRPMFDEGELLEPGDKRVFKKNMAHYLVSRRKATFDLDFKVPKREPRKRVPANTLMAMQGTSSDVTALTRQVTALTQQVQELQAQVAAGAKGGAK